VNHRQYDVLLKFVKAQITGDARSKLLIRDLTHSWGLVKEILQKYYAMWRTLHFYACKMFRARQSASEVLLVGVVRYTLQTDLREAARRVCKPDEIVGAIGLINHLGKACTTNAFRPSFVVEESQSSCQATEISFEEESAIRSTKEK
jgi:hypothetical protein